MFSVTASEYTAEGTVNILVSRYISLWGYPSTISSKNGRHFCAQFATTGYKLVDIFKVITSASALVITVSLNASIALWHK